MFWKLTSLSASSPVESVLDKGNFTLEELLDEEEVIQECKALNSRLINFLQDRRQVKQLVRYIIEEPPEDAEIKLTFKFPFIACEIFTCEIDVILKTLVEEEQLMNLLFSYLEPNRPHSSLLAGYFSKVVGCLMLRKAVPLMKYVQAHQYVFCQLVDLVGITSIMEVLIRLVSAENHLYPNFADATQWLADSSLLEMIVDKLNPSNSPEVHVNVAETLSAITRNGPSVLASKLSSPSFIARIFDHALKDSQSKSVIVHSLSVCISILDPKRSSISSSLMLPFQTQHANESAGPVRPETVSAMLPKLADLLSVLNVLSDENMLPTPFGELKPPLGKHRLKIVEFILVLLKRSDDATTNELLSSTIIKRIVDLFFEYPYNNTLHHYVENIVACCLETKNDSLVDHLLQECDLIGKILQTEKHAIILSVLQQPTVPAHGKHAPRAGNIGHITKISNKLIHLGNSNGPIQMYLQENAEWNQWKSTVLQERNAVENIYRWSCGRPTALQDRTRDSDEDEIHGRDYDIASLANNLNQPFRYNMYGKVDAEEGNGGLDHEDEDVFFDDDSTGIVISSLRLGDDQESNLFTNSNWFAFQEEMASDLPARVSAADMMDVINLNGSEHSSNDDSSNDEIVVKDEELTDGKYSVCCTSTCGNNIPDEHIGNGSVEFLRIDSPDNKDFFEDKPPLVEWLAWGQVSGFSRGDGLKTVNPFEDHYEKIGTNLTSQVLLTSDDSSSEEKFRVPDVPATKFSTGVPFGTDMTQSSTISVSLFDEDVEFVGVELESTGKEMEHAHKKGIVGCGPGGAQKRESR